MIRFTHFYIKVDKLQKYGKLYCYYVVFPVLFSMAFSFQLDSLSFSQFSLLCGDSIITKTKLWKKFAKTKVDERSLQNIVFWAGVQLIFKAYRNSDKTAKWVGENRKETHSKRNLVVLNPSTLYSTALFAIMRSPVRWVRSSLWGNSTVLLTVPILCFRWTWTRSAIREEYSAANVLRTFNQL